MMSVFLEAVLLTVQKDLTAVVLNVCLNKQFLLSCLAKAQYAECPESDTKVFVHYMLWYGELGVGHWGQNYYPEFDIETDGCDNEQHVPTWFPPINPPGAFRSYDPAHILRDITLLE